MSCYQSYCSKMAEDLIKEILMKFSLWHIKGKEKDVRFLDSIFFSNH